MGLTEGFIAGKACETWWHECAICIELRLFLTTGTLGSFRKNVFAYASYDVLIMLISINHETIGFGYATLNFDSGAFYSWWNHMINVVLIVLLGWLQQYITVWECVAELNFTWDGNQT